MALVDCKEFKRTGTVDDQGQRTWVRSFKVTTNDPQDGPYLVMTAPGIVYGDAYNLGAPEIDLFAYARNFTANPYDISNSRTFWQVDVTYTSKAVPNQFPATTGLTPPTSATPPQPPGSQSPPDRNWTVSYGTQKVKTVMYRDLGTGKRVVSSNGLKYGTPLEAEHVVKVITIGAWFAPADYDLALAQESYINSVNASAWQGYDAGVVKCEDLTGEYQYEQGDWWLQLKLVLHVAAGTMLCYQSYADESDLLTPEISWDVEIMNIGLKELKTGEHFTIMDKNNKPVSEPHPLAQNGTKLTIPAYPTVPSYTYKRYRVNPRVDWTEII